MITRRLAADFDMTFGHSLVDYLRDDEEAVGQNIRTRLLLILGEWFLDTTEGTPWRAILGVKPFDRVFSEAALRRRVLGTYGVAEIVALSLIFNSSTRHAVVSIAVRTIYSGTLVSLEVGHH